MARERDCPDCGVAMDATSHATSFQGEGVRVGAEGLLGRLGLRGRPTQAYVCPSCDLVRFYAE